MYKYIYTSIYIRVYMYVYIHTHIYMYIYGICICLEWNVVKYNKDIICKEYGEYYSATGKKETVSFATTWVSIEGIVPSEYTTQRKTNTI